MRLFVFDEITMKIELFRANAARIPSSHSSLPCSPVRLSPPSPEDPQGHQSHRQRNEPRAGKSFLFDLRAHPGQWNSRVIGVALIPGDGARSLQSIPLRPYLCWPFLMKQPCAFAQPTLPSSKVPFACDAFAGHSKRTSSWLPWSRNATRFTLQGSVSLPCSQVSFPRAPELPGAGIIVCALWSTVPGTELPLLGSLSNK